LAQKSPVTFCLGLLAAWRAIAAGGSKNQSGWTIAVVVARASALYVNFSAKMHQIS
jgi:hypothetical protein